VEGVRLKRNAYRVLVGKQRKALGISRSRWKANLLLFVPQLFVSIGLLNNWKAKIMDLKELG
jgi:hypothetical protein